MLKATVIGGGLAGCEAALRLSALGAQVDLIEARPLRGSAAHKTDMLGELVCSNSLKSEETTTASGLLKAELDILGCRLLEIARGVRVPAGSALAVDRELFARAVTDEVERNKGITRITDVADDWDPARPTVIATGPLTVGGIADAISSRLGGNLHFYDAAAPIVSAESVDMSRAFTADRYGRGESDYVNCPMDRDEYYAFTDALAAAETVELHGFDRREVFEGCMPVEIMAARGRDTLRFGPLRPVGFTDPVTGKRPFAVVQLRKENVSGGMYNLVGFQTNLRFGEQKRVFSMIPALKNCEILRYGVMHRNSIVNAPQTLNPDFSAKGYPLTYIAGQLSGVEGYVESIAAGLVAAINLFRRCSGQEPLVFPPETVIGALQRYLTAPNADFQPMNANFGILPPLDAAPRRKSERKAAYYERGVRAMREFVSAADSGICAAEN